MKVRQAALADIPQLVELQHQCHITNLDEVEKADGFLNTVLSDALLETAILNEQCVYIAEVDGVAAGLAVCASWQYWSISPTLSKLSEQLSTIKIESQSLSRENSYFWGPVCVSKAFRGQGVFEALFTQSRSALSSKYKFVYTYVHQDNHRSYIAHTKKAQFTKVKSITLNEEPFDELVRVTA
ncbi:GNAT family N-acetyltransferase [Vibrio sp. T187]|uniref:GNAT family N-acetyltransferase n=1 Tax=Vibrio TaxID=662 RepID=UPI0010C99D03|nr:MULTISPECIES: GNAT family N-acetyltransferase [Vibrio]MBW3696672.1 GNAT family N-acetyltransferase [Vibrio sp. T187]